MTSLNLLLCIAVVLAMSAMNASAQDLDWWRIANTSVWLSAASYCDTSSYETHIFKMYSAGFKVTNVIDVKSGDVQVQPMSFCSHVN
ncbi:hypothetical protein EON64_00105 [archaeon]|nr:MAG: hypothetical protein EON64_00105 [archaeon]